jgi:t-SNARE complex subunit (syntaxin)
MVDYARLAAEPEVESLEYIEKCLKDLKKLLGQFAKATVTQIHLFVEDFTSKKEGLAQILKNATIDKQNKAKIEVYKSQFKELCITFDQIHNSLQAKYSGNEFGTNGSFPSSLVEYDHLAFQDEEELKKAEALERGEKIREVHKDFVMVNQMFVDVKGIVDEQGNMLGNAERNVEVAVKQTEVAGNEPEKAQEHQKSARRKMCWIMVGLLILIAVAAGFIFRNLNDVLNFFKGIF